MADTIKIKVPDIGGADGVDVIEVLVKVGDIITVDTPMVTLESDKASMEIPAPQAGKVSEIVLKVGDKVSEGDLILTLETDKAAVQPEAKKEDKAPVQKSEAATPVPAKAAQQDNIQPETTREIKVSVPDIGGATDVDVIEVMVKPDDVLTEGQSLITLEGDKATMEIPAPSAGTVKAINIKVGDKVSQGSVILTMLSAQSSKKEAASVESIEDADVVVPEDDTKPQAAENKAIKSVEVPESSGSSEGSLRLAGPAVRRLARELGVDLSVVKGSGRKSRISKEDLQSYVKEKMSQKSSGGFSMPTAPSIDFSKFGAIEQKPLNKIKRITGQNVHRSWITIPHVTQFDEADITDLEAFRNAESSNAQKAGYKLTLLAFVIKAVCKALAAFPQFNASLDASGEQLILKKYFNVGIAVETPNGLVVPVIRDADKLSVKDIAMEMARLSSKAREKGLMPADMSGGCFTISSLGGIGGTAFTPIVNSPEVAILGLSRSSMKPVYDGKAFIPRLMLPLSLSYDHRVIDGAEAARFTAYIRDQLADIRRVLL